MPGLQVSVLRTFYYISDSLFFSPRGRKTSLQDVDFVHHVVLTVAVASVSVSVSTAIVPAMRPALSTLVVALLVPVLSAIIPGGSGSDVLNITHPECQAVLDDWMWQLRPDLDGANATLSVRWGGLDRALVNRNCRYDSMWLELWRLAEAEEDPPWRRSDVRRLHLCDGLHSGRFLLHSSLRHRPDDAESRFGHAVEERYVLRLCPCGKRSGPLSTLPGQSRRCDCEYRDSRSFCSQLLRFPRPEGARGGAFHWCGGKRDGGETDGADAGADVFYPRAHCDGGAVISGVLASCTPIQVYDRVRLRLYKQQEGDAGNCDVTHHRVVGRVPEENATLTKVNLTHGSFSTSFKGKLESGASYCLTLDLVEHPYCHQSSIIIVHAGSSSSFSSPQTPSVCSSHVVAPLTIGEACRDTATAALLYKRQAGVVVAVVMVGIVVVIFFLGLAFVVLHSYRKRKSLANSKEFISPGREVEKSKRQPLLTPPDVRGRKVYLLHFGGPAAPSYLSRANEVLRRWMTEIGCEVFDPSDSDRQEEIAAEQEMWSRKLLDDEDCGVVVVVDGCPFASSSSDSGAIVLPQDGVPDPVIPLKAAALQRLQSPEFVGNYRRVAVVTFGSGGATSSLLADLTSMREMRLPEHLVELAEWLGVSRRGGDEDNDDDGSGGGRLKEAETQLRSVLSLMRLTCSTAHTSQAV